MLTAFACPRCGADAEVRAFLAVPWLQCPRCGLTRTSDGSTREGQYLGPMVIREAPGERR